MLLVVSCIARLSIARERLPREASVHIATARGTEKRFKHRTYRGGIACPIVMRNACCMRQVLAALILQELPVGFYYTYPTRERVRLFFSLQ